MDNNDNNNDNYYNIFFWLGVIANLLQIENYNLNVSDLKNSELMKELQKQDQILNEQNEKYLKKILKNQEKIIKMLEDK